MSVAAAFASWPSFIMPQIPALGTAGPGEGRPSLTDYRPRYKHGASVARNVQILMRDELVSKISERFPAAQAASGLHAWSPSAAGYQDWSPALLKAKAYEQLLLDIIMGEFAPGSRLDEQELAARYNIGLAGVRDALGRLALEGMVQRRARFGTTVAPIDLAEVQQAFEARMLIEPHIAALAAQTAPVQAIGAIHAAFAGAERAVEEQDYRALVLMDQEFHRAVARAGGNLALMRVVVSLHHCAARLWRFSLPQRDIGEWMEDVRQHRAVGCAIESRDPAAARAAMQAVVGAIPDSICQSLALRPAAAS